MLVWLVADLDSLPTTAKHPLRIARSDPQTYPGVIPEHSWV